MGSPSASSFHLRVFVLSLACLAISAQLSPTFYDSLCPQALATIRSVVEGAVTQEPRMGASLLRLHFHDCFVNGCDGSLLLDSTDTFETEKNAFQNLNSTRGFEVVDNIKAEVDRVCGGPIVSCADILAVAARDSVVALRGQTWEVLLGRRDSTTANITAAESNLPLASFDFPELLQNFDRQGLNLTDLVVLSAAHTLGLAQCRTFRDHIYNETNIDPDFARELQAICPSVGGDTNVTSLDSTPENFDTDYFARLMARRGVLHSDQELFNGTAADDLVRMYSTDFDAFRRDFANSMIKMGNLSPLTGTQGQIRSNCRTVEAVEYSTWPLQLSFDHVFNSGVRFFSSLMSSLSFG